MVANTGDRPVQVGSHYPLRRGERRRSTSTATPPEAAGWISPPGTAVRFEPGQRREVRLIAIGGAARIFGFNQPSWAL